MSEWLQKHQRDAKIIALHDYKEDFCASESLESDYLEDRSIRKRSHDYHLEASWSQKIRAECFVKTPDTNVLPRNDFHMVMITVVYDIMQRSFVKTPTTLPLFNTAVTEYCAGATADGEKTKAFSFTGSLAI